MDIINLSFVDHKRYQEKALEFSFHLHRCTPAKVEVRQSYESANKAYLKVVSGPETIPQILLRTSDIPCLRMLKDLTAILIFYQQPKKR